MKTTLTWMAALTAMAALADPYTGLWVGAVSLRTVNEVSVPLDENNEPKAPVSTIPTPTGDQADLRLILHVNDAGQVSLLKDVAIINRNLSGDASATIAEIAEAGSDAWSLSLVTDPSLYIDYPMQKATRVAGVAFDFGDARATHVLDALMDKVVVMATNIVSTKTASAIATASDRNLIIESAVAEVKLWGPEEVSKANVAASYQTFLDTYNGTVQAIAATPGGGTAALNSALALRGASPFGDTRAEEFVRAIQQAGTTNGYTNAWNAAANAADVANTVRRLLSGKVAGDALIAAARYAATNASVTASGLSALSSSTNLVRQAADSKWNNDTRATSAVNEMFVRIAAVAQVGHAAGDSPLIIQMDAAAAGQAALLEALAQYPASHSAPTAGYTAFVTSDEYTSMDDSKSVLVRATRAAVAAALTERVENPLTYTATLTTVAKTAILNAVQSTYSAAARVQLHALPLDGTFGLDSGDPTFTLDVPSGGTLSPAGLTGTISLPANHPTNPFRHRRHPDHTTGFDITRNIRIDFDALNASGTIPSLTRGVSTVGGLYREEIFGLHKPLGANQDVGIRTEGRFQLNRISTIGTLNGR